MACASCHNPRFGFTDGQSVPTGIEDQAVKPMAHPDEMGFTHDGVVERLRGINGYREQFEKIFGTGGIAIDHVAQSIAAFERTVLSGNSSFDRFAAGETTALSPAARRGHALFWGNARCFRCHVGFNFTDESYHNIGVGMDQPEPDLGRFEVTRREQDRGAFKTPTLRDIALTTPYFHDGSTRTLEDVVEWYDKGGMDNPQLDPKIKSLGLTARGKADLVEFLKALTGESALEFPAPELPQ